MAAVSVRAGAAMPHPVAIAPPQAATASSKSSQSSLVVPDIVENRREDGAGGPVSRHYIRGKLLGKGGFAKCFLFTAQESGRIVAGKCVSKESLSKNKARQKLLSEIKIHRSLNHPYIVGFDSFFEDKANVYIMLELCPNQTMLEFVKARKRLSEGEARYYTMQLVDAMRYLHSHNIIHRDLKLGNLFLSDTMDIRVGDFGLATQLTHPEERKRTICGTPNYIAPEILVNKDGHSFEVDVWALGVIIYTMLIGKPPFETAEVKLTYQRIKENSYSFPEHIPISSAARDLISGILRPEPRDRPTLEQLISHPWFIAADAKVPRRVPLIAMREEPRFTEHELRSSVSAVRDLLSRPIGGLLVRHSSRQAPEAAPLRSLPQQQTFKHVAPPMRLETVPDESVERTRRAGSVDTADSGSIDDDAASEDMKYPTSNSLGAGSSASSLRSLRMAVARATIPPSSSWRQHAAAAAGDDKENAVPAGYSGMHAATAAAKRTILSMEPRPSVSIDENEGVEDSDQGFSYDSAPTTRPNSVASSASSWNREKIEKRMLHPAPNSTLDSGAGQSFDLAEVRSARPTDMPATMLPLHRASSAPMLVRPVDHESHMPYHAEVPKRASQEPENAMLSIKIVAPELPSKRKALGLLAGPKQLSTESQLRPTLAHIPAAGSVPTPLASSISTNSYSLPSAKFAYDEPDTGKFSRRTVEAAAHFTPTAKDIPPVVITAATSMPTKASVSPASTSSSATALNDTLDVLCKNLTSPDVKKARACWEDGDLMMTGVSRELTPWPTKLTSAHRPKTWVSIWVDYTSKYGLGYLLTNGNVGVYFNDSTKIILSSGGDSSEFASSSLAATLVHAGATADQASAGNAFEYIDRPGSGRAPPSVDAEGFPIHTTTDGLHRLAASLKRFPKSLEKKVKLLVYFKKYLAEQFDKRIEFTKKVAFDAKASNTPESNVARDRALADAAAVGCTTADNGLPVANQTAEIFAASGATANGGVQTCAGAEEQSNMCFGSGEEDLPFVKKYVRTRRALLFRLSNRTFQAAFYDGFSTLIHKDGTVATFTDPAGIRSTYYVDHLLAAASAVESGAMTPSVPLGEVAKMLDHARRLRYTRDVIAQLATASKPSSTD